MLVPADPPLPDAVRAMIDAAFASGEDADVEAVVMRGWPIRRALASLTR
jgi:hypothetical protein